MELDSFITVLMGRGLSSELAQKIGFRFSDWEGLGGADSAQLAEHFSTAELDAIRNAKSRRAIPLATVNRLINECGFRCCLCWNVDADTGVVIHHIRAHATAPDDRYENLVVLCSDHHAKVHTTWELTRHPYPPELLLRRKAEFVSALAEFRAGNRVAPGRERTEGGVLVSPPLPPPHFIGRDTLIREIAGALQSLNGRAAIVGMGGVGKTALALKVATACREHFPGGILWTEDANELGSLPSILRSWLRSLGHDTGPMEINAQLALFSCLLTKRVASDGRLLLLIDDVGERIVKDLVRLTSYVPTEVSILISTRKSTVGIALGATEFRVEPMSRVHSRQLLESVSGSGTVQTEAAAVEELLSLLGDLPLAVELVARQTAMLERKPGFSIAELCRRLVEFDDDILSFSGHRGVAMSFALSYDELDESEQKLFRSLGIFAYGPLYTDDVSGVMAEAKEKAESILDRFVMISILNWGPGVGDYRIHPLLLKYAAFLFGRADTAEQNSVRLLFYRHYTSIASTTARSTPDSLKDIDRMLPNLMRALEIASVSGDYAVVCETMLGLSAAMSFFTSRNLERESIPVLEMAIAASENLGDREKESVFNGHLGTSYSRLCMVKEAITHYENAISIARETGDDFDLASHLQNLGTTLLSESKDLPRAERLLHEALAAAERSQNADVVLGCFSALGNLHRAVGSLNEAARLYAGALEAARLSGERLGEGNNLSNLGLVMCELGDVEEGERMLREALAIAVEIGDRRGEGNRTGHIGGILIEKARRFLQGLEQSRVLESAREHVSAAILIAAETGDSEKLGTWLMNLGIICALEGNLDEGIKQYEKALALAKTSGLARLEAQARFNLGSSFARRGQFERALGHFHISGALARKMGSPMALQARVYVSRLTKMLKQWLNRFFRG